MALQMITWLLFFAMFYMLVTTFIFLRNRFELTPLSTQSISTLQPKISVCIPARNEESSINTLLTSLENQTWPHYEVFVLDDQSSDQTFEIAESYQKKYPRNFFVNKGKEKPNDWLGKPWACHQLSKKCNGDILLFLDADTELQPDTLKKIAASFHAFELDMLTVWPQQKLHTFWENVVIPLVLYVLMTNLPAIYVYRNPRWMPASIKKYFQGKFAAANGQCIAFKKKAYQAIGGHQAVKKEVVEDVKLAKYLKEHGLKLRMFNGVDSVACRMYQNEKEIFKGFRKNFLAGFNYNVFAFIIAGIFHLIVFVLPFIIILISLFSFYLLPVILSTIIIFLIFFQRLMLAFWYKMNPLYTFTHPIGVLWFERLAIVNIWDQIRGNRPRWKGREV